MDKPMLEILEQDDVHKWYVLWQDIEGLSLYERSKVINRFLKSESKVMERVLESDLRHFLREQGIIPQTMTESALKESFDLLKRKGKSIEVIDRNALAYNENIVGVSDNEMTIVIEYDKYISLSMEIRIKDDKDN